MIALVTSGARRADAIRRRDGLAEEGLCINGRDHGKATHGVLCLTCREVHRGHRLESLLGADGYRAALKEANRRQIGIREYAKEIVGQSALIPQRQPTHNA